jgi:hypothetical protein
MIAPAERRGSTSEHVDDGRTRGLTPQPLDPVEAQPGSGNRLLGGARKSIANYPLASLITGAAIGLAVGWWVKRGRS